MTETNSEHYQKYKKYYDSYGAKKIICKCGSKIRYDSTPRHLKTIKHILFLSNSIQ